MKIVIRTEHMDGKSSRSFSSLKSAQDFAQAAVGQTPEISEMFHYAVGDYGLTLRVSGCRLIELFPLLNPANQAGRQDFVELDDNLDNYYIDSGDDIGANYETVRLANQIGQPTRAVRSVNDDLPF